MQPPQQRQQPPQQRQPPLEGIVHRSHRRGRRPGAHAGARDLPARRPGRRRDAAVQRVRCVPPPARLPGREARGRPHAARPHEGVPADRLHGDVRRLAPGLRRHRPGHRPSRQEAGDAAGRARPAGQRLCSGGATIPDRRKHCRTGHCAAVPRCLLQHWPCRKHLCSGVRAQGLQEPRYGRPQHSLQPHRGVHVLPVRHRHAQRRLAHGGTDLVRHANAGRARRGTAVRPRVPERPYGKGEGEGSLRGPAFDRQDQRLR
mmetsp:Transcript_64042/g.164799  ORF Transcript_64042/g.164799 Transcript_64042/m.164799 type:complete len:259 (+) Transcript_64042:247-1023(+)